MAESLPKESFTLTGGCFCTAITYTIFVPAFPSRPLIKNPVPYPIGPQTEIHSRLPVISIDHCNSCRRVAGAIVWSWFICPISWGKFSLCLGDESGEQGRIEVDTREYLIGEKKLRDTTHLRHFSSSAGIERTFCGNCGTHLTYYFSGEEDNSPDWGGHFDISVGSFDKESVEREGFRISKEGHVGDAIPWVRKLIGEGAKGFDV